MDKLEQYRGYIQQLLTEYAQPSSANSEIEKQFIARKVLAEEWLNDNCTDERKEVIEIEIHKINQYVADLLGIEYQMND